MIDLEKTPTIRADIELVQKLQAGDFQPIGVLMDRYGRDLMHYLASILNNREAAEDVFQETWSRVLQSIRRFDLEPAVRSLAFSNREEPGLRPTEEGKEMAILVSEQREESRCLRTQY